MQPPFISSPSIPNRNQQFPQSQQDQSSKVRQKINNYRTEIKNQEIRQFKSKIRYEMIQVNSIEEMLKRMPFDNDYSVDWASNLMNLYRETINFRLSAVQTVELFRLVQKFPNKTTLNLLQIVISKADVASIDQIFQDIMKLLHSCIKSCQKHSKSLSNSHSSEQNAEIIRQVVICSINTHKPSDINNCSSDHEKLQLTQVTLNIIAELCRKEVHIRNFAVLNNKTFTYCLKAYKQFGTDIRLQFYELLQALTYFCFQRNEEQFSRITNQILIEVFRQRWQLNPNCKDIEIKGLTWLLKAMYNLLKNQQGWIAFKLQLMEKKQNRQLFTIFIGLVKRCNHMIVNQRDKISSLFCKLIVAAIQCIVIYQHSMDTQNPKNHNQGVNQKIELLFELVVMLRQSKDVSLLEQVRPGLYFLLYHYCYYPCLDQKIKYSLMIPQNQLDLLSFLANLLFTELKEQNVYELSYLLHTIFQEIPLQILEQLLLPSEVLQNICLKILDNSCSDPNQGPYKTILVKSMIALIQRLDRQFQTKGTCKACKNIIYQFCNKFQIIVSSSGIDDHLCSSLEDLLCLMKQQSSESK